MGRGRVIGYALQATSAGLIFDPGRARRTKHGAILMHGAGATGSAYGTMVSGGAGTMGSATLAAFLAANGIPCIATDLGGPLTFGKDSVVQVGGDCDTALVTLAAATGVAADSSHVLGVSMGTENGLRLMMTQPAKVKSARLILPNVSLGDAYVNNRGGYQSVIGTAWGITYPTALPARADASLNAAAIASSGPVWLDYSTVDAIMLPTLVAPFIADLQSHGGHAGATACDSTYGHDDRSVLQVDYRAVLEFFLANDGG